MNILALIIVALIGEAIWETLKMTWQSGKVSIDRVGALIIGLLLALSTGIDLMAMVGIPMRIPYLGMILTGLLISRGANFIHDIIASINNIQNSSKANLLNAAAWTNKEEQGAGPLTTNGTIITNDPKTLNPVDLKP